MHSPRWRSDLMLTQGSGYPARTCMKNPGSSMMFDLPDKVLSSPSVQDLSEKCSLPLEHCPHSLSDTSLVQ